MNIKTLEEASATGLALLKSVRGYFAYAVIIMQGISAVRQIFYSPDSAAEAFSKAGAVGSRVKIELQLDSHLVNVFEYDPSTGEFSGAFAAAEHLLQSVPEITTSDAPGAALIRAITTTQSFIKQREYDQAG
jgi:hypothetical protein